MGMADVPSRMKRSESQPLDALNQYGRRNDHAEHRGEPKAANGRRILRSLAIDQ